MIDQVHIDYLILANHVEAINGMLYISGGGWTDLFRQVPPGANPPPTHLGIGLSVAVPWNETNATHRVRIRIEDSDAQIVVLGAEAAITVGRPPHLTPGTEQHLVMALPADLPFPKQGEYRVQVSLGEDLDTKTWVFRVHDVPPPPPNP